MKDITEAFAVLKAIAERERPEIVSFGDSETMHATGIVGWLRGDGRWKLLDGFDPAMSYPERLEIRRQALMSDLFITGVNAISMEGSLHWLDKVGNRIAPVAFGPRKVVIVAGRNKIVADRAQAEERIRTIAAPGVPHAVRPDGRMLGLQLARPRVQHAYGDDAVLARRAHAGRADRSGTGTLTNTGRMKAIRYIAILILAAALAACGEKSEPYYTTSYPVSRVEATVTLGAAATATAEDEPEPEPEPDPDPDPEPEPEPDPVIEAIRADVLAEAPVQAGGGYVLEFLYHNSGWLYITPAPDAAPITGSFNKEPDKPDQLRFFYEDADYTYAVSYYSEEGKSLTLLTVDLTAKYQALYPTAGITKVERLEYTTHPF